MPELTRRRALGAAASALAGLAVADLVIAGPSRAEASVPNASDPVAFDEVFLGRRIQGGAASHEGGHHHGGGYRVRIDGDELHVMRNADGSWISVVNHYETFATPRAVARAAVRELQGADLVPLVLA
ncbi:tyrosinase cofactor [Streptomyces maoxianensis]|uniref:Tyrosinase cofactor n=1 Tax=Streptomyces maoxianensis TaxID=1459942 RepID=A0ABV9GI52_9ACTN|nr:tyrosinase cofactor [Streptomyces sp. ISL-1]MBT2388468.1 tyrosinase cofactor [Streptomyces sp. ISL-1]